MLSLKQAIEMVEYGNRLYINVWPMSRSAYKATGNLPASRNIHATPICDYFKSDKRRVRACFKCHSMAIAKALREKKGYCGRCVHGMTEYCQPVVYRGEVIAVIFLGNMCEDVNTLPPDLRALASPPDTEEHLATMGRYLADVYLQNLTVSQPQNEKINPLTERVREYADHYFATDLSAQTLASQFHYNAKYLGRLFYATYGVSFSGYVNEKRLTAAADRLLAGKETVTEVAMAVGFNSVSYFNRLFKERFGCPPHQYAKN